VSNAAPSLSISEIVDDKERLEVEAFVWGIRRRFMLPNDKDYFDSVSHRTNSSGLLFPTIRYVSPDKSWVIMEKRPQEMALNIYPALLSSISSSGIIKFLLPIPWTVYAIRLNEYGFPVESYIFARNRTINSDDDRLYLLPLPNCYDSGRLCLPSEEESSAVTTSINLGESINIAYHKIWSSNFNMDLNSAILRLNEVRSELHISTICSNNVIRMLKRWEEASFEEVLSWEWPNVQAEDNRLDGFTFADLIEMGRDSETSKVSMMFNRLYNRIASNESVNDG